MYLLHNKNCLSCNTPIDIRMGENAEILEKKSGCNIISYRCPNCGATQKITDMLDENLFNKIESIIKEDL